MVFRIGALVLKKQYNRVVVVYGRDGVNTAKPPLIKITIEITSRTILIVLSPVTLG